MQTGEANFADRVFLEKGYIVFFHQGDLDNGKPYYLYLAVNGSKLKSYYALLQAGAPPTIQALEQLGKILAFGEGFPTVAIQEKLAQDYGIQPV